jgi:CheY-like chemotaxis protein
MATNERPHGAHASDERKPHILQAVEARLRGNPNLALKDVSCAYAQGVLTSRGSLSSDYLKQFAQEAMGHVERVEHIDNLIQVLALPPREIPTGDAPEAGYVQPDAGQAAARPLPAASGHQTAARRVLVVGDQWAVVENWTLVLCRAGHRVRGTWSAPEALALAAEFQPEAAVLDLRRRSSAIARKLRRVPGLDGTLLITLAEHGTKLDQRRSRAPGCDYHLTKPVDVAVLLQLLAHPVEPL